MVMLDNHDTVSTIDKTIESSQKFLYVMEMQTR